LYTRRTKRRTKGIPFQIISLRYLSIAKDTNRIITSHNLKLRTSKRRRRGVSLSGIIRCGITIPSGNVAKNLKLKTKRNIAFKTIPIKNKINHSSTRILIAKREFGCGRKRGRFTVLILRCCLSDAKNRDTRAFASSFGWRDGSNIKRHRRSCIKIARRGAMGDAGTEIARRRLCRRRARGGASRRLGPRQRAATTGPCLPPSLA